MTRNIAWLVKKEQVAIVLSKFLALIFGITAVIGAEKFQSMRFDGECVGVLLGTEGQVLGSGFSIGSPQRVLTCAHVAVAQSAFRYTYVPPGKHMYPVSIETILPKYDLAVLRLEGTNQVAALPYGDVRRIRPGDQVVYAGYSTNDRALKVSVATVTAVGVAENEGISVDFLEFEGEGRPGYSGGPVFNVKGEVVAVMREAWTKRGVKGGNEVLVNRAFSIEPAMLSKEIFYPAPATPASTNMAGSNTITIRLDGK